MRWVCWIRRRIRQRRWPLTRNRLPSNLIFRRGNERRPWHFFSKRTTPPPPLHLEKALALGLEDARLHNFLGICYSQTNRMSKAVREHQRAIELDPKLAGGAPQPCICLPADGEAQRGARRVRDCMQAGSKILWRCSNSKVSLLALSVSPRSLPSAACSESPAP